MVAAKLGSGAPPTPLNIKKVAGFPKRPNPSAPPMLSPKARLNPKHHPEDADQSHGNKTLKDGGDDVFWFDHASVKESQSRGHQEYQGCGGKHPCCISPDQFPEVSPVSKLKGKMIPRSAIIPNAINANSHCFFMIVNFFGSLQIY